MERTGRTLGEYLDMGAAGKVALIHYIKKLDPDSKLAHEAGNFNAQEWSSSFKTAAMLADLYDKVQEFEHIYIKAHSKTKPRKPKPYPRPWAKPKQVRKFGKKPIQIKSFWNWWKRKDKDG